MATIVCSITGHSPEDPVFVPKTGHVYERRLIEKHIESSGKCPISEEALTLDDLVAVKANKTVRPRPPTAASVPGMMSMLQGEWDALMSETYVLKTNLDTTRKQLSHALYQHDASCRVIARLYRERDAARAKVQELQEIISKASFTSGAAAGAGSVNDQEETGFSDEFLEKLLQVAKALSKTRKKREFPDLAPVSAVKEMKCASDHPIHQSTAPGITCVDIHKTDNARVVTGGNDSQVILFDSSKGKTVQKLGGHTKKINSVVMHHTKNVILSASNDATARMWVGSSEDDWLAPYTCGQVVRRHKAEVTDVCLHNTGDFYATASKDKTWALHDLLTGRCMRHVVSEDQGAYNCMQFHPDGAIIAGGTAQSTVAVWDIKTQGVVATLKEHTGPVEAISFSENGYYLASASQDGTVKLWDLRKPLMLQSLKISDDGAVNSVKFDQTGQYLAVGAKDLQIYKFESKTSLGSVVTLQDHTAPVMGVCFGSNARSIASVSMDRTLRFFKTE